MGQSESKRMSDYRRRILSMDEDEEDEDRGISRGYLIKYIQMLNPLTLFWQFLDLLWKSYLFRRFSTRTGGSHIELFCSHPLLRYKATYRWMLRESPNVLVLMRGLPGSGKSTLVSYIRRKYPSAFICSADHFFINPESGEYKFRIEDLPEAHNQCQKSVLNAMFEDQRSLIIVDNTSISKWEMEPYFALAASGDYSVLVIHPSTPWATDVEELHQRSIHEVPLETLSKKLKKALKKPVPLYYGWFLSNIASRDLLSCSYWILRHCLETCPDFKKAFLGYLPPNAAINEKKLLNALVSFYRPSDGLLHVTAKYIGFDVNSASAYINRVEEQLGEVHGFSLIGYTFSRYAFGARVRLCQEDSTLGLFEMDESFVPNADTYRISRSRRPTEHLEPPKLTPSFPQYMESNRVILGPSSSEFFSPNPGKGKRTHITLGTRHGSQAVNTGYDALRTAHAEKQGGTLTRWEIPGLGVLRRIDSDLWTLYLLKSIELKGIFTGLYK